MNMHSKIFQIESFPVEENYRITEDNYIGDHWFVYSIADYVAEDESREHSLEWLKDTLSCAEPFIEFFSDIDGCGFILLDGFHAAYFKREYEGFINALTSLTVTVSPEAFAMGNLEPKMFALNTAYDDRYGFYVDCDDTGLVTLNQFLRQAKPEIRYYFGGTVDYHC
nr:MAG TPA: hypothetical protein [Bacteriophage sp.]